MRTEPDKNLTELLGLIRRDFSAKPPKLEIVEPYPTCEVCFCSMEDNGETVCGVCRMDRESTENLPGH